MGVSSPETPVYLPLQSNLLCWRLFLDLSGVVR